MVRRYLKPFALLALLLFCVGSVYATTCAQPTADEAEIYARQDGENLFVKGFLWGLILSAYLFNVGWFIWRTNRWITAVLLSVLCIPAAFGFWFAEILSQPCGFGGMAAKYYLIPLVALILLGIAQIRAYRSEREYSSIFPD